MSVELNSSAERVSTTPSSGEDSGSGPEPSTSRTTKRPRRDPPARPKSTKVNVFKTAAARRQGSSQGGMAGFSALVGRKLSSARKETNRGLASGSASSSRASSSKAKADSVFIDLLTKFFLTF